MSGSFGARVRDARKAKGLTQEQLARAIGTTMMTISNYERDMVDDPKSAHVRAIAAELGVTTDFLYSGPQAPTPEPQTTPDLPPRLLAFLELVPVTEGERRALLGLVASDGTVDYLAALHRLRAPEHKRTPDAPATLVEVPDDAPRARPAKRR